MNVVLVNDHLAVTGGVARVAISEAVGLAEQGHNVIFFGASGEVSQELLDSPVRVEHLNQVDVMADPAKARAAVRGIYNRTACERLRLTLSCLDPAETIVHFHSWTKGLSPRILSVPAEEGYRSVLTLHDFFVSCPNGGFIEHPRGRICTRKPLGAACIACNCDSRSYAHKLWRVVRQGVQEHVWQSASSVDAYIAVSAFCHRILQPHLDPAKPVTVVHNPVAVEKQPPATLDSGAFAFVGRLSREKGAALLAEAALIADTPCKFIGDGGEARRVLGTNPHAEMLGWRSHREVIEQIRTAAALVFPSIWYETQGLTVLEAMGNGVPVIVSDCTAAAEYVQDGYTGLHFRAGDANDLACKLKQLKHRPEALRLGRNAYNWFWDNPWSLSKHIQQLIRVYERLLPVPAASVSS